MLDYGIDAPARVRSFFSRGVWTLIFALALYWMNRAEYPGPSLRLGGAVALIGVAFLVAGYAMVWSSRTGKLRLRDRLVDALTLEGGERVLDAGCGLGLLGIAIAKRLKSGKVIAADTWDGRRLRGCRIEKARENAKVEGLGEKGVAEKLRFENLDWAKLAYPDANFEVVVSALAIHELADPEARAKAVRELYRVLKPGGRLVIVDYQRPQARNPLYWPMVGILRTLEPFALDLWRHEIREWLPHEPVELKKSSSFGGLYQLVTITA
jgi:ubiquinone/menaquinone biosynthesis C-methylase UbiE